MKLYKIYFVIIALIIGSFTTKAQENILSLSSGYSFASFESSDNTANGWRLNGVYEFNPNEGNLSHGLAIGYIGTELSQTLIGANIPIKLNNWPIYYAPKYMFGNDKFKGFVKGALGLQFAGYKVGEAKTSDTGLYAGASLGSMYYINDKIFLNLEYEWAYMSNTYYREAFMNSILIGIGSKF